MRGIKTNGDRICDLRKAVGWTQEELAAAADCATRTLRNAEQGKAIDAATLAKVATALGVSISEVSAHESPQQQRNIDITKQWKQAFIDADVDRLLSLHHPDTVLELPDAEGLPHITPTATFRGLKELRRHFEGVFSDFRWLESYDDVYDAKDSLVFHRNRSLFRGVKTGRETISKFYNELEFADGLIIRRLSMADLAGHRYVLGIDDTPRKQHSPSQHRSGDARN